MTTDPLWYKDTIIYETHVKAFFDSTNDGIGDFRGLTEKLEYLADLGIGCIWLLPFYPSPLRDDGYDISDYKQINPLYGTMRDFRQFIREAHRHGIRVITELVLNHTSDLHPWFQAARTAPAGATRRNYYVWSNSDDKYSEARKIFSDSESSNWRWDPAARAYYWHRFFGHQPDLNYDNPAVLREMISVLKFWLDQGVDGFRLDAVPYLIEREGTNCENLIETHEIIKKVRMEVDANYPGRVLLAEANQWPEDVRAYLGEGDECHMAFHFPLMPRIFMSLRQEDRHPVTDILRSMPNIPESCQWGLFLRNHDELTLEMVTDEERDYMYKFYAADPKMRLNAGIRRRLAPLMDNSRRRIELLNSLLFSLKGTPILYYGDEIGMGDNIYLGDRNGVRSPMQWNGDRNAGFSKADFAQLYASPIMDPIYGYHSVNVEAQRRDPSSLLNWMKRMIALRNKYSVFGRGKLELILPKNRKILAYVRSMEGETILCVANLSRFAQPLELDLSQFKGLTPVELLGHTEFPRIQEQPYFLTLAPHSFYWFLLKPVSETLTLRLNEEHDLPLVEIGGTWDSMESKHIPDEPARTVFLQYLKRKSWFSENTIRSVTVRDRIFLDTRRPVAYLALVDVQCQQATQLCSLPLVILSDLPQKDGTNRIVAYLNSDSGQGYLLDGSTDNEIISGLLDLIRHPGKPAHGRSGELLTTVSHHATEALSNLRFPLKIVHQETAGNHFAVINNQLVVKLFRKMEHGPNHEVEVLRHLTNLPEFSRAPKLLGAIEYRSDRDECYTIALLQSFIPNQGSARDHILDDLGRYYERADAFRFQNRNIEPVAIVSSENLAPSSIEELLGSSISDATALGACCAEFHNAMMCSPENPEIIPEADFHKLAEDLHSQAVEAFLFLEKQLQTIPVPFRPWAAQVVQNKDTILDAFHSLSESNAEMRCIRIHGDLQLQHLLWVKNQFAIFDFEGETCLPVNQRRAKQLALKDIAAMMHSIDAAAYAGLLHYTANRTTDFQLLQPWAKLWQSWYCRAFFRAYVEKSNDAGFINSNFKRIEKLLYCLRWSVALWKVHSTLENDLESVQIPLLVGQNLLSTTA